MEPHPCTYTGIFQPLLGSSRVLESSWQRCHFARNLAKYIPYEIVGCMASITIHHAIYRTGHK
eukprot:9623250-Karenia_brevis.AAC.1